LEAEGFFLLGRSCVNIKEPTITVLGLGNILMTDEGVGVHTINEFEKRYTVPDYVEIVDGGAAGLDLIPFIEGREKVLMVDAVNFDREPGYIDLLENDAIPIRLTQKASMHHLGLMDVLCIVRMSGNIPKELCIIGIQPKSLDLGIDMTKEIWDKVNDLIERIVAKLREWNIPCVLRSPQK